MDELKIINTTMSPTGQVTIPQEARKILNISEGDRVSFIIDNNQVIVANQFAAELLALHRKIKPELEKSGLNSEEDIIKFCKEIRKEKGIL
jgi:AbrB family looped-hinge helix DNA binding protein